MRATPVVTDGRLLHAATFNFRLYAFEAPSLGPHPFHEFDLASVVIHFPQDEAQGERGSVSGTLVLGYGSDGLDLLHDDVAFRFGTAEITIPAGSFDRHGFRYSYDGTIGGATVASEFEDIGGDSFNFVFRVESTDLSGTSNPLTVSLRVGNDSGETTERLHGLLTRQLPVAVLPW